MHAARQPLPISPTGLPVQRGHARARLHLPARLVTFTGTHNCVLVNLSCSGARISAGTLPKIGAMVVVEAPPLELFGTVKWTSTGSFGFAFDEALSVEDVVAMRHHADAAPERERQEYREHVRRWVQGT